MELLYVLLWCCFLKILKYCISKNKYKKKNLKDIKNIAIINEDEEGNNIKEGLIDDKNDENTNKALENQ